MPIQLFVLFGQLSQLIQVVLQSILSSLHLTYLSLQVEIADVHVLLVEPHFILDVEIMSLAAYLHFVVSQHLVYICHQSPIGYLMEEHRRIVALPIHYQNSRIPTAIWKQIRCSQGIQPILYTISERVL